MTRFAHLIRALSWALALCAACTAHAADSIKIGFSTALTGGSAAFGRIDLVTREIWAETVNAKGGLLGRPVQLVHYDDQGTPANAPAIYTKLIDVDKVDLITSTGTNVTAAAMPVIMQRNRLVMSLFSLAVNDNFKYPRYFQITPYGPNGTEEISRGFFEAAMTITPKPQTIALGGADAEFALKALGGARAQAQQLGLKIVYDRTYPPSTMEFSSIIRAIAATHPDMVFIGSYPADTSGLLHAALEGQLETKVFGGAMVGPQLASMKAEFGDKLNGLVAYELYVPGPTMSFPGIDEFIARYRKRAAAEKIDLLGDYMPPFVYAAMQVLEQAVNAVGSLDEAKLSDHLHRTKFSTIVGDVQFGADGEWAQGRILTTQFQNVKGNGLAQFDQLGTQVVLYPKQFKTGELQPGFPRPAR